MCKLKVKWLYVIEKKFSWPSGLSIAEDVAFEDETGARRLELRTNGEITVLKDYAWDGCTPKFCVFDIVFGVPDGVVHQVTRRPKTYYASLIHDALYQFLDDGLPLSRKDADNCFLQLMRESDFVLSQIYYWAVRGFGEIFRRIGKWIRKTRGRKVALA
ncbi:MAG: DUF1353 domain-containing protein [bacterium]